MENAKVVLFEDDPEMIENARYFITLSGHEVVAEAVDRAGALAIIATIADGDLPVDVIVFDANLSKRAGEKGDDARFISQALFASGVSAVTIGFSSLPMSSYGVDVDVDLGKSQFLRLGTTISEL